MNTPTPWTFITSKKSGLIHIESSIDARPSGEHVCSVSDRDNAEFIVRACNAHDDLLDLARRAWLYEVNRPSVNETDEEMRKGEVDRIAEIIARADGKAVQS